MFSWLKRMYWHCQGGISETSMNVADVEITMTWCSNDSKELDSEEGDDVDAMGELTLDIVVMISMN